MTERVRSLLRGPKDHALAFSARVLFNSRFSDVGELTDLAVDSQTQTLQLRLSLAGESEPLVIHVGKYRIRRNGDQALLTITDATASRPWLDAALRHFVLGRSITVPQAAATALKLLA